jgi:dihydropteroate synthase
MPTKILFVTGRLAEPALRRTLVSVPPPCAYEIVVMPITVAALMTTSWIAKQLTLLPSHPKHVDFPPDCDLIMIPGLCEGDLQEIEETVGISATRGPADVQDIPLFFGKQRRRDTYGAYSVQIIAEIQDALQLSEPELLRRAEYFRDSGVDVIDLGVTPGSAPGNVARAIQILKQADYRVSIDTMDAALIREADTAGVDYVLSLNHSNIEIARELQAIPVVIPDDDGDLTTLWRNAELLWEWGIDCILDPIVQPIGFGLSRSLHDLYQTRQRYREAKLMLGSHHLTELTDADSTGINALAMGIAQELNLAFVLTTEVIPWARGSVRELDVARRLMHYAINEGVPPKRLDDRLLTIKDSRLLYQDQETLREMQAALTDPNIRIFIDGNQIYAFNADVFAVGTDIQEIFEQLGIDDASHAFYLGRELTKAQLALHLGKNYRQDQPLRWGYLTFEEQPSHGRRVRLTHRRRKDDDAMEGKNE